MKIPINKESMSALKLGDTVTAAIGGTMKVTERKQGIAPRPHDLKFEGFSGIYSYSDRGILCGGDIHPLDIVAIEKAQLEIPEGFTRWDGGRECPVPDDTKVEYMMRNGDSAVYESAEKLRWFHQGSNGDIIAYRVLPPPQQGEIWMVVWTNVVGEHVKLYPSKKLAVSDAKYMSPHRDIIIRAIFQPFLTGGKWKEGDGRELWEGK